MKPFRMKTKRLLSLFIFFTIIAASRGFSDGILSVRWEYQVLEMSELERIATEKGAMSGSRKNPLELLPILLNVQGDGGWELCGIIAESFVFKRIASSDRSPVDKAKAPEDERVSKSKDLLAAAFDERFLEMPEGIFTTIVEQIDIGDEPIIYLQVKDPTFKASINPLDEADRLNGISWKAHVEITFSVFRDAPYPAKDSLEWSEWRTTVAHDGIWASVVEVGGQLKIEKIGMSMFTNSPVIETAVKPQISSSWEIIVAEEDWGNTIYASQSNETGQFIKIFSAKDEFKPALLLGPYKESYGAKVSIRVNLDGGNSFMLQGVRSDYFGEIVAEGFGEKEIKAIRDSKSLDVTIADSDTFSFSLEGVFEALRPILDLGKESPPLTPPPSSPSAP